MEVTEEETAGVLLEAGADVIAKDKEMRTALFTATAWGTKEQVALLLSAGAVVNTTDSQ